jgi:hypothetical protein
MQKVSIVFMLYVSQFISVYRRSFSFTGESKSGGKGGKFSKSAASLLKDRKHGNKL